MNTIPGVNTATQPIPVPISPQQLAHLKPVYAAVAEFYQKGGASWEQTQTYTWQGGPPNVHTSTRKTNNWHHLASQNFGVNGPAMQSTNPNNITTYIKVTGIGIIEPWYPDIKQMKSDEISLIEVYARFLAAFNKMYQAVYGKAGNRTIRAVRGRDSYTKALDRIAYLRGACGLDETGITMLLPYVWDVDRCNINTGTGAKYMESFALAYYDTFPHITTPPSPWN